MSAGRVFRIVAVILFFIAVVFANEEIRRGPHR